ncbi:MAG: glycosyltransferase family 39 protein [Bryobacteraceae bacterium]
MTVLEPTGLGSKPGTVMLRIHEKNYHVMPLSYLAQAVWFKLAGFSLPSMRFFAILWGLLALLCWKSIIETLTGSVWIALFAAFLMAMDHAFLECATDGRPDIMSAALGALALVLYLRWRETSLPRAILAASGLFALSVFTHPMGGMVAIPLLLAYGLLDWKRFRLSHILLAAAPLAIAGAAYAIFIFQDYPAFQAQFGINAGGRLDGVAHPLRALMDEVRVRYFERFYLPGYAAGVARLRVLIIFGYWFALLWALLMPEIRKSTRYRLLIIAAVFDFVALALFDGTKSYFYIIHILPFLAGLLAAFLVWAWHKGQAGRFAAAGLLGMMAFLQIGWDVYSIYKNPYRETYLPAVAFLREHAGRTATIIGSGELGFELGFDGNLRDDSSLGFYSGRKADFVVVDERAYKESMLGYAVKAPALDVYVKHLLSEEYTRVYDGPFYQIYQRKP